MVLTSEQYERLMRYMDAEMTLPEMEAFEQELKDNPKLEEQLVFEQCLREALVAEMQHPEETGHSELVNNASIKLVYGKRRKLRWWLYAAVAILVGCIMTTVFLYTKGGDGRVGKKNPVAQNRIEPDNAVKRNKSDRQGPPPTLPPKKQRINTDSLFRTYFEVDKVPDEYPLYLADAFDKYKAENYDAIINLNITKIRDIRGVEEKLKIEELGYYYKGIAYLKKGNTGQALPCFNMVKAIGRDTARKSAADWYKMLTFLKAGDTNKAENMLKHFAAKIQPDKFAWKAVELLKILGDK